MPPLVIVVILLALAFDFLNGVHDSSNVVATMISSRAIRPQSALAMTAAANLLGPFIFGVAVAKTIGSEIVAPEHISIHVIVAALLAAIVWNVLTWLLGIPSSSSHALIGGLIGAVAMGAGLREIQLPGVLKVAFFLFASPIIGFLAGILVINVVYLLSWKATPRVNTLFKRLQVLTSLGLALSHGTNDAQKSMGVITMALVISGVQSHFVVPPWVIVICALAIGAGTALGGWRLIKTLGSKFYKIRPIHGFASQVTSAAVILISSVAGGPVSTTQVVSGAILGVGAAERMSKVRWGVARDIIFAWLITIPSTILLAAGAFWLIDRALPTILLALR